MSTPNPATPPAPRRDLFVAFLCGGLVAGMVGLSFAAVPFYSWFCRTTGLGGTTQTAKAAPAQVSERSITVRFDSNVAPGLPWRFEPERRTIEAHEWLTADELEGRPEGLADEALPRMIRAAVAAVRA